MKRFKIRRKVKFSAQQMYALVADVDSYPEFLPLCESMRVRGRRTTENGEVLIADMTMGYKAIRETISSQVTLTPSEPLVTVQYLEGPFSQMENRWRFLPADDGGCEVEFYMAYSVRNPMLSFLVSQLFDKAFRRFAHAFEARAKTVYGADNSRSGDVPDAAPEPTG
ncbi:MAG: type II toxin-antitoxin system RatA family toxin [Pseudomonadota bacterium]